MKPLRSDPAMYTLIADGILKGMSGGRRSHSCRFGDFKRLSLKTNKRFDMSQDETLPCPFTGFSLSRNDENEVIQDQHEYLNRLESSRSILRTPSFVQ